jgi:molybdenum cofactor cytidylyltransferase
VSSAAGLMLAAGAGRRFGDAPKQLAALRGRPLLEHAVRAQVAVLERVVVVLGARAAEVLAAVALGPAQPLVCAEWADGQSASLRCGLRALAGAERVVVTLGDQPLPSAVVARLAAEPPGTRASFAGVPGHPVVLGPEHVRLAEGVRGDRGLRDALAGARLVECGDLTRGRDVDTPEDLEEIAREARAVL